MQPPLSYFALRSLQESLGILGYDDSLRDFKCIRRSAYLTSCPTRVYLSAFLRAINLQFNEWMTTRGQSVRPIAAALVNLTHFPLVACREYKCYNSVHA